MVSYKAGVSPAQGFLRLRAANPALTSQVEVGLGIWKLNTNLRDGFAVLALANSLQANPVLNFASPDFIQTHQSHAVPSDPLFADTWGLRNTGQSYAQYQGQSGFDLGATAAWDVTMGSPNIVVLVMDDGVQLAHPDLNVGYGADFTGVGGGGNPVTVDDKHGTPVAGCIAGRANNGIGSTGIAPNVRIAAAKISNPNAQGNFSLVDSRVVAALNWGRSVGARISNCSWGGGLPSAAIDAAFQATKAAGMTHFCSTGNGNSGSIIYPSSSPHVNAVGAAAPNGTRISIAGWWGSNYGPGLKFMAPGIYMWSPDRTGAAGYVSNDYTQFLGTSAASPYAAGVAALILSREPNLTPDQLTSRMSQTCTDMGVPGYDTETGSGMLNAARALGGGSSGDDYPNTIATAASVSFPGSLNGRIETNTDRDVFRFVVTNTTAVTLKTEGTMDDYGFLYNSSGTEIARNDDGAGNLQFLIQMQLTPGTYFLAVESYANASTGSYRLILEGGSAASPNMIVVGNNNNRIADEARNPNSSDGTLFTAITQRYTTAERQFVIHNTGTAPLAFTGSPIVAITGPGASQFFAARSPGSSLPANYVTDCLIVYRPSAPGTHDAIISIASSDPTSSPYTFSIRGMATFTVDDHGNDASSATSVARPSATDGVLHDASDVDCFRFTLPSLARVTIRTYGNIDTLGYLMNASGTIIASADDNETDLNFVISTKLPAGSYIVRVQGYDSAVSGSYSLSVR